jgi:phytoene/squalene synthetase
MNNCQSLLEAQDVQLPKSFDSLPAQFRVGLLSFQVVAKAMKKAFKEDQSVDSVNRLFALFLKNQRTSEPLLQCAIEHIHTLPIERERISLIQSQLLGHLEQNGFPTSEQFESFVDTVFGSFGQMAATLFPASTNAMELALQDVAKAIGVSRTLREIHGDVANGFLMIPQSLLAEYQVDLNALLGNKINEGFAQMINSLIEPQRRRFASFYEHIDLFPSESQLALYTFAKTQEAMLDEIIWNRYDCLNSDLGVSDLRLAMIRIRAKRALKKRGRK